MTDQNYRPVPPGDCECCENGCTPCVWDTYIEALNEWNAKQAENARKEKEKVEIQE